MNMFMPRKKCPLRECLFIALARFRLCVKGLSDSGGRQSFGRGLS